MSKRGLDITLEQAKKHAAKHGYSLSVEDIRSKKYHNVEAPALPKPVKMTRPEREYGLILEAMKRRGDIVDYRFQGMSLAWGADPATGRLMRYKCDWLVITCADLGVGSKDDGGWIPILPVKLIEVKGAHIWPKDMIRFKGCRSEWTIFEFELHQLKGGQWTQIQ